MFILYEKPHLEKKIVKTSSSKNSRSNVELRALIEIAFQLTSYKDLCNLSLVNKKAFNHLSKILINATLPNGTGFFRKSLAHCHRAVMDKRKYYDSYYSSNKKGLIAFCALLLLLFSVGYGAVQNISLYNKIKPEGNFESSFSLFSLLAGYLLTQFMVFAVIDTAVPQIEHYSWKYFYNMHNKFLADLPIEFADSLEDCLNGLTNNAALNKK